MSKYDFKEIENTDFFSLWEHGCWCDIIHCHVPGLSVDFIPAELFAGMLNHRIYRRGYIGSSDDTYTRHGPFEIYKLKPGDFVEISFDEWIGYIHARYADIEDFLGPPNKDQVEAVDDFINQLSKEGLRYFRLAVDHEDPDYHHEWWTFHDFFDEYILVNPQQESMWIIVLGYD